MGPSEYVRGQRALVGHSLLLLPAVTAVPTRTDGCVLLGRHADTGRWGSIGGGVEPGESPREALSREIGEELGVGITSAHIVGSCGGPDFHTTYPNGDVVAFVTSVYVVQLDSHDFVFPDGELVEARWFTSAELNELDLPPWLRVVLIDVAAFLHPTQS